MISLVYAATPLSVQGALLGGGRFNPKGLFGALYLAEDPITALHEIEAVVPSHGLIQPSRFPPKAVFTADYELHAVLDLTDPGARAALGTNPQELSGNWRGQVDPPTQILGDIVHSSERFEAIKAPSARTGGHNLVVFPDRLAALGGSLRVLDPPQARSRRYRLP